MVGVKVRNPQWMPGPAIIKQERGGVINVDQPLVTAVEEVCGGSTKGHGEGSSRIREHKKGFTGRL